MPSIPALLRSLGNDGALGNVQAALDARAGEDWLIAGLAHRLERRDQAAAAASSASAGAAAAA